MPIKLTTRIKKGWKQEDNQRFGDCLETHFVSNDKTMFIYAPKLEDKAYFDEMFKQLEEYDNLHKAIYSLCKRVDGDFSFSWGDCQKVEK